MRVLLFARLRDEIGQEFLDIDIAGHCTLARLKQALAEAHSLLKKEIEAGRVLTAVNQALCHDDNLVLTGAEEIALFPPMTGG